jgi:hypothetical protein
LVVDTEKEDGAVIEKEREREVRTLIIKKTMP